MENGKKEILLQEFEFYLKVDESTGSYAPIDPNHTDEEVEEAFRRGKVGIFDCYVTLLSRDHKPLVHRLRIKPKKNFAAKQAP
jgi:type IV secretory pathway VirB4 component